MAKPSAHTQTTYSPDQVEEDLATLRGQVDRLDEIVYQEPSGDTTGAADLAKISGVLSAGQAARLLPGTWYISAPVAIPSGGILSGARGSTFSLTGYGAVLKAGSSFSGAALVTFPSGTVEQQVADLTLDGTGAPSSTDGIQVQGSGTGSWLIRDVTVIYPPGYGLNVQSGSGGACRCARLTVRRAGLSGIADNGITDSDWNHVYVIGSGQVTGSDGWTIGTASNTTWTGCRSEDSLGGNGFTYTTSNTRGNGVNFNGCSTQGNAKHGFEITSNTGNNSSPVTLTGCRFNEDGVNGGSGGGGYAGIYVTGFGASAGNLGYIRVAGCQVVTGAQFTTGAPDYGSKLGVNGTHAKVRFSNCLLNGMVAGSFDTGFLGSVIYDATTDGVTGLG